MSILVSGKTFKVSKGKPADPFCLSNAWNPHVTFTVHVDDKDEIEAVQKIIDKYEDDIVAYWEYTPFCGMSLLEVQFKDSKSGSICHSEYRNLFTTTGCLKTKFDPDQMMRKGR